MIGLGFKIAAEDVVLNTDYAYPRYGVPSDETNEAIRLSARLEGMMTDPVYEGKSMQGMIDLVRKDFFPAGSKVLYAHLGGVPAINAIQLPLPQRLSPGALAAPTMPNKGYRGIPRPAF